MTKRRKIILFLLFAALTALTLCVPALALTESEVEAQVAATSKAEVSGNVLIWFLCAVAFLKVSQKIDSFMSSLGINVGRTGGSLLAEAMIAVRSVTMVAGAGRAGGGGRRAGAASGSSQNDSGWFLKGGLAGVASRKITNSAIKTATTQTSAVRTAQSEVRHAAAAATASQAASGTNTNSLVHTSSSTSTHNANGTPDVPLGSPTQEGVIVTGGDSVMPGPGGAPLTEPISGVTPTQGGEGVTNVNGEPTAPPIGSAQPVSPPSSGMPPQEGTIITDGGPAVQMPSAENAPPDSQPPVGTPPQEGTIVTGGGPTVQTFSAENIPPDGQIPIGAPPQEGVIFTGSEPASPITQPECPPQVADISPGSPPADMTPPSQDGIVITEGSTTVYAPQADGTIPGGLGETMRQESTTHSQQQTGTHSERASQSYQSTQSTSSRERVQTSHSYMGGSPHLSLGGMIFSRSLAAGGQFANDVIGTVARGEVAGSITGDMAVQSLTSYMGPAAIGSSPGEPPSYSDVEIGRGRITGMETVGGTPLPFAMYHADQYTAPAGEYSKIITADGTQWYKQYAQDAVERKPYKAPDDTVAYHERIIKKLPDPPKRKDRI